MDRLLFVHLNQRFSNMKRWILKVLLTVPLLATTMCMVRAEHNHSPQFVRQMRAINTTGALLTASAAGGSGGGGGKRHDHGSRNSNSSRPTSPNARTDIHIVLARFDEALDHLEWLTQYNRAKLYTIYNRGETDVPSKWLSKNLLENVGRESFIYLSHIIKHYHSLADVMVFSQAINHFEKKYVDVDFQKDVEDLIHKRLVIPPESDGFAFFVPYCFPADKGLTTVRGLGNIKKDPIFTEGYTKMLNYTVEKPRFCPTACFAVTRNAILRNSRQYYIALTRTLNFYFNPIAGHFFERAWPEVFHSNCSAGTDFHCRFRAKNTC